VHRTHHSAEALTFLTSGRVHPFESVGIAVWGTLWTGCAAAALSYYTGIAMHPLFPAAVFFWLLLTDVTDKLQHSHVRTSLGPLNYIIASGEMHQIHHSAELKHRDKNFGSASSVFDWMFGTIYIPRPEETIRLGLSEQEIGDQNPHKRAIDIYTEPFAYAWRVLGGGKIALIGRPRARSTVVRVIPAATAAAYACDTTNSDQTSSPIR
jgi:sterol desaturase/sphingolipid hydroxylase (fatty acid hydroxylase superfamily)